MLVQVKLGALTIAITEYLYESGKNDNIKLELYIYVNKTKVFLGN